MQYRDRCAQNETLRRLWATDSSIRNQRLFFCFRDVKGVSLVQMMRSTGYIAFYLAFSFCASLFWCGDLDCLSGKSNEDCSALMCSILKTHDLPSTASSTESSKDCSCVCHVPSLTSRSIQFTFSASAEASIFSEPSLAPSSPNRPVFRPPIAS